MKFDEGRQNELAKVSTNKPNSRLLDEAAVADALAAKPLVLADGAYHVRTTVRVAALSEEEADGRR